VTHEINARKRERERANIAMGDNVLITAKDASAIAASSVLFFVCIDVSSAGSNDVSAFA